MKKITKFILISLVAYLPLFSQEEPKEEPKEEVTIEEAQEKAIADEITAVEEETQKETNDISEEEIPTEEAVG